MTMLMPFEAKFSTTIYAMEEAGAGESSLEVAHRDLGSVQ